MDCRLRLCQARVTMCEFTVDSTSMCAKDCHIVDRESQKKQGKSTQRYPSLAQVTDLITCNTSARHGYQIGSTFTERLIAFFFQELDSGSVLGLSGNQTQS